MPSRISTAIGTRRRRPTESSRFCCSSVRYTEVLVIRCDTSLPYNTGHELSKRPGRFSMSPVDGTYGTGSNRRKRVGCRWPSGRIVEKSRCLRGSSQRLPPSIRKGVGRPRRPLARKQQKPRCARMMPRDVTSLLGCDFEVLLCDRPGERTVPSVTFPRAGIMSLTQCVSCPAHVPARRSEPSLAWSVGRVAAGCQTPVEFSFLSGPALESYRERERETAFPGDLRIPAAPGDSPLL